MAEAFYASREAECAAVVFYGATAMVIELCIGAAWRYAGARPELLHEASAAQPEQGRRRVALNAGLYGAAVLVGVLVLPRLAAIAYLVVAARAVFLPGGEGRLTLRRELTRRPC